MAAIEPPPQASGNDLLNAALEYAQRGWPVFPLHSPGRATLCDCADEACSSPAKHPWTRNGLKDATTDLATIQGWWRKWPRANIAIACGPAGLVVLDVDPRHGGELALVDVVKRHANAPHGQLAPVMEALTATLTSETGGGGEHYVYRTPDGMNIRNAANLDGLQGLDVRGDGGYIVAAPSMHVSGARYQWREGATDTCEPPEWLIPVLARRNSQPLRQPVRMFAPPRDMAATGAYWLDRALRLAQEGNRNDRGFWLACQLRDSGLSEDAAAGVLESYAAQAPGAGYSQREALHSARSAYKGAPRESARSLTSSAGSATLSAAMPSPAYRVASPSPDVAADAAPAGERRPRFHFLTDEECENMPPPVWLIDGLIVQGQRSMIFGEPGSYKSFLALDLALCIATGASWHGHKTLPGRVVYIAGEGQGGMGKRIKAWKAYHGYVGSAPISILGEAAQLLHSGDVEALLEAITALPDAPVAIIIDTLARAIVGGDENSAKDMGQVVAAIDRIHDVTGAHIMVIHHKARGAKNARGSTAVPGGMDTTIDLTREGQIVTVHCPKQKEAAEFPDMQLRFHVTLQADNALESSGVLVPAGQPQRRTLPPAMLQALAILREAGQLRHAEWERRFLERAGQSSSSFENHRRALFNEGLAANIDDLWRVTSKGEAYPITGGMN